MLFNLNNAINIYTIIPNLHCHLEKVTCLRLYTLRGKRKDSKRGICEFQILCVSPFITHHR